MRKLGMEFPPVLDEFGNSAEQAYSGCPDRRYLVYTKGKIALRAGRGDLDELATALERVTGAD